MERLDSASSINTSTTLKSSISSSSASSSITSSSSSGNTSVHKHCRDGNLEKVKKYISKDKSLLNLRNKHQEVPLHLACSNGHLTIVKYLVEEIHVDLFPERHDGQTPLHRAIAKNHIHLVKYLIQYYLNDNNNNNFSINAQRKPPYGDTFLHIAFANEYIDICRYLIFNRQCDINIVDNDGISCLHWAVKRKNIDLLNLLLIGKEDINVNYMIQDIDGESALHLAMTGDDNDSSSMDGTNKTNNNNKDSKTMMIISKLIEYGLLSSSSNEDLKQFLIIKNKKGYSPLQKAIMKGLIDIVRFLLTCSSTTTKQEESSSRIIITESIRKILIEDKTLKNESILSLAKRYKQNDIVEYLQQNVFIKKSTTDIDIDIDVDTVEDHLEEEERPICKDDTTHKLSCNNNNNDDDDDDDDEILTQTVNIDDLQLEIEDDANCDNNTCSNNLPTATADEQQQQQQQQTNKNLVVESSSLSDFISVNINKNLNDTTLIKYVDILQNILGVSEVEDFIEAFTENYLTEHDLTTNGFSIFHARKLISSILKQSNNLSTTSNNSYPSMFEQHFFGGKTTSSFSSSFSEIGLSPLSSPAKSPFINHHQQENELYCQIYKVLGFVEGSLYRSEEKGGKLLKVSTIFDDDVRYIIKPIKNDFDFAKERKIYEYLSSSSSSSSSSNNSSGCVRLVKVILKNLEQQCPNNALVLESGDLSLRDDLKGSINSYYKRTIAEKLIEAVGDLHRRGIVHNDLKPENIVVIGSGRDPYAKIKLCDLDSAAFLPKPGIPIEDTLFPSNDKTGELLFTSHYAAPEIVLHSSSSSSSSSRIVTSSKNADLFSLGLILAELFNESCQPIFNETDNVADIYALGKENFYQKYGNQLCIKENSREGELIMALCAWEPNDRISISELLNKWNNSRLTKVRDDLSQTQKLNQDTLSSIDEKIQEMHTSQKSEILMMRTLLQEEHDFPRLVLVTKKPDKTSRIGKIKAGVKKTVSFNFLKDICILIPLCPVCISVPTDPFPGPKGKGYEVKITKEWLRDMGPCIKIGMTVIKIAMAAGRLAGLPLPHLCSQDWKAMDEQIDTIIGDGFSHAVGDYIRGEGNDSIPLAQVQKKTDESYRALRKIFKSCDPELSKCGLYKIIGGHGADTATEWVCKTCISTFKEKGHACL